MLCVLWMKNVLYKVHKKFLDKFREKIDDDYNNIYH